MQLKTDVIRKHGFTAEAMRMIAAVFNKSVRKK